MKDVVVTGLGFITSIGNDRASVTESLRSLRHGIAEHPGMVNMDSPVKLAGTIKDFDTDSIDSEDWTYPSRYRVRRDVLRGMAPHVLYGYCAIEQALEEAELTREAIANDPATGMFTASSGSTMMMNHQINRMHEQGIMRCSPMGIVNSVPGTLSFNLVALYKVTGSSCGFASACASSGHALGFAFDEVATGRQDRMIVVGGEDWHVNTILPFAGMRALSPSRDPDTASRPFDKARDGFVGTGGAVVLILESADLARERGAPCYAHFRGWAQASDGHSVAISHPEGDGLVRAMRLALKSAGIEPAEIRYVNAHAASTPIGDASEMKALKQVFGTNGSSPAISSTKALTGHGLSLASILEAGLCIAAGNESLTPGSAHISEIDPEGAGLQVPRTTEARAPWPLISNSSGFGGANVCLVFDQPLW
ncbi:MAG: beta-ketoacyl-[acyl-carrier-protein] synthase family protein [Opitutales bacterium]